jgi:hypothetical protein
MRFGIFDHLERRHHCDLTQQYPSTTRNGDRLEPMGRVARAGIYGSSGSWPKR